ESQFRTMKYRPEFPDRFGSFADSRLNASGSRQTSLSEVIRATEIVEIPGPSSGTDFSFRSGDCFTASGGSGYHNLRTTHSVSPPLA
ncbi:MAG: hypothetical protein ABI833_21070, partial [Acidobacteriota bacterium]